MIKLNNKGFAISTILYGILTLTIIILMLIFGIMKSNKDMNQDLVQSLEEKMNNCILSELALEKCYFEGNNNCDTSSYDQCTGKKIETKKLLYDLVNIGDFVAYDAGVWASNAAMPTTNNILTFGGYTAGNSKNNSSNGTGLYNGWRVIHKYEEDKRVVLIHAGIPEYFSFKFDEAYDASRAHLFHNYQMIIYNTSNGPLVENYNSTYRDWDSIYANDLSSSYYITSADINFYKEQTGNSDYASSDLINIGESYLIDGYSVDGSNLFCLEVINEFGKIECLSEGVVGIRPIVMLKEGVLTTGYLTNTYGIKEWLLIK